MSSETIVAKRYAKALFDIAQNKGQVDLIEEELKQVVSILDQNQDLKKFLQHPNIEFSAKMDLLTKMLKDKLSADVFNTISLMIQRKRGTLFPALLNFYTKIVNDSLDRENALVITSYPLNEQEYAQIKSFFSKMTGKDIRVEQQVDPSLLGGIKVRIGDRLFDGSLLGKLDRLKKSLNISQAL